MPSRPLQPKVLQRKSSKNMLQSHRKIEMESNRLSANLDRMNNQKKYAMKGWTREYNLAEASLGIGNMTLSDHILPLDGIINNRPRAPSALQRYNEFHNSDVTKPRQRRPQSVFSEPAMRSHQATEEQTNPCKYNCGSNCKFFPCALPASYSFISNKKEMLDLYDLVLHQLPSHKRPQTAATDTSDLSTLITEAEYIIHSQDKSSMLDPLERTRLLKEAVAEWKRRHALQKPEVREIRYGKPYPMRRILKPISSSFFLR